MAARYPDRSARRRRLEEDLQAILPRIVDEATDRVILFGSLARGSVGSASDLDLLVVRRDARPPAVRAADLYDRAQPTVSLDLLVFTPEELAAARNRSSFIRTALGEGRVIYERGRALA